MVLEEPSVATERAIRGVEREKYKDGVGGAMRGVKRGREDSDDDNDNVDEGAANGVKVRGLKRAKGPNPLSVMKKKPKRSADDNAAQVDVKVGDESQPMSKSKARRKRGKRGKGTGQQMDSGNIDQVSS